MQAASLARDLHQLELEHRKGVGTRAARAVSWQRLERAAHHALRRAAPADDLRVAQRELEAVYRPHVVQRLLVVRVGVGGLVGVGASVAVGVSVVVSGVARVRH